MWNFIPQLFYDFLARIVPGATLLVLTLAVSGYKSPIDFIEASPIDTRHFTFGTVTIWILASYLIGLILGQLCQMIIQKCKYIEGIYQDIELEGKEKCIEQHNLLLKALGKPPLDIAAADLPEVPIMRDHLRHVAVGDAARLVKVRAEQRLCEVLALGFLILLVIDVLLVPFRFNLVRIGLVIVLPFFAYFYWKRACRARLHLTRGTTAGWLARIVSQCLPV